MSTIPPSSALPAGNLFSESAAVLLTGGTRQPSSLGDWFISRSIVSSRFRNAEMCTSASLFYKAESYSTMFIHHFLSVHACTNTHTCTLLLHASSYEFCYCEHECTDVSISVACFLGIQTVQLYVIRVNMIMMCNNQNREGFVFNSSRCNRPTSDSWITRSFCI